MNVNFGNSGNLLIVFWVIWCLLIAVVHLAFAYGVFMDADLMKRRISRDTRFVSPILWTLGTLLGGIFVAGVYWIIHHSTLNPDNLKDKEDL
jgi:hypothetical protein